MNILRPSSVVSRFGEYLQKLKFPHNLFLIFMQIIGALALLYGISQFSVPCAYVVGGLGLVIAIEMQSQAPAEDPVEEALIRAKIDSALKAGTNPFEAPGVPMSPKWINYVSMFVNRSSAS